DMVDGKKYRALYLVLNPIHWAFPLLLLVALLALLVVAFPAPPLVLAGWAVCFAVWVYLAFRKRFAGKMFWLPAAGMIILNIFIANYVYVKLLGFEAGAEAGRYIRANNIGTNDIVFYKVEDQLSCLDFYA